jgi:diguanylate cyclase (GGDEF)-like protein
VLYSASTKLGAYNFIWVAAMSLLAEAAYPDEGQKIVYTAILVISVILAAIARPGMTWVLVYAYAAVFYSAQLAVEHEVWFINPAGQDFAPFINMLQFAGISFAGAFIPWWVLKKRSDAQAAELSKTQEEARSAAVVMARAREIADSQPNSKKKSIDQLATVVLNSGTSTDTFILSAGGDEENVQLQSMLFFMRYNFKALTAGAFIYDPAKRVLALNCYETKGGTQIKEQARIPLGVGVIGQVAAENRVFMSGDLSLYQSNDGSYYLQDEGVASILAAPIVVEGSKEFLGVLAVDSTNKNAFTEHDKELMRRFSIIAAALIVNIRMSLALEHDAKIFRMFYETSHGFSVALKVEEILDVLMGIIPQIVPACGRLVYLTFDSVKNCLRIQRIAGAKDELSEGMEFLLSSGIYSFAFTKNKVVNSPDYQTQAGKFYRFAPEEPQNPAIRTLVVLPIMGGEDRRCLGLLSVESGQPDIFKKEREQLLTTIIENATVAITRSLLYLKMEKLATTDGLTGLNNHRTFQEIAAREFERARRYGRPLSMLLTDIDHFKSFNDTYGHPVGDMVLREIAGCIRTSVRANDYPARYGGEEFAVVLPETDEQGAYVIAERIRQTVENRVIDSGENKLRVTISIGCVTFPTYGTTQQDIIDCADKALYTSKKSGRNRVTHYNPQMTVASK